MYGVAVQRGFEARHFLVGGDWGAENNEHGHPYRLEVRVEGPTLDEHNYLIDITVLERELDGLVARYGGRLLNDLPEFRGVNPSLEHFARVVHQALMQRLTLPGLCALEVRLWETEQAWAAYREEWPCGSG